MCTYIYTNTYKYIQMYTYNHMYICIQVLTYIYIYMLALWCAEVTALWCANTNTCAYLCLHANLHVRMFVCKSKQDIYISFHNVYIWYHTCIYTWRYRYVHVLFDHKSAHFVVCFWNVLSARTMLGFSAQVVKFLEYFFDIFQNHRATPTPRIKLNLSKHILH